MNFTYIIILRLIHIYSGVFWAGSTFYLAWFILPAVNAIPEGGKFMQQLGKTNKLPVVMMVLGTLNILSGILLILALSSGHFADWMGSEFGMSISIGGTTAFIAWIIGISVNRPAIMNIGKIGKEIALSGGAPSPAQIAELTKLRNKLNKATKLVAWLLIITVLTMSIARYI